jgi:hypothetical protein
METISLLKHRRFDPELIDSMSAAYASVCQTLGLVTKSDQATEIVAPKIIEIATRGARSPTTIHLLAMEELREQLDRVQAVVPLAVSLSVLDEN